MTKNILVCFSVHSVLLTTSQLNGNFNGLCLRNET